MSRRRMPPSLVLHPRTEGVSGAIGLGAKRCVLAALLALCTACNVAGEGAPSERGGTGKSPAAQQRGSTEPAPVEVFETEHYAIATTATPEQTQAIGAAVESLHRAYSEFFAETLGAEPEPDRLQLRLYRNRSEFVAHSRSLPWAEAYYRAPICHAYYAGSGQNPYHWMVHEATHQLNHEVAGFKNKRWMNEGLATYFGASRIDGGRLRPGTIDPTAYPIWWLSRTRLSGDLRRDIEQRRWIPLRDLLADTGPEIGRYLNLYYVEYWSLSHFLFHYRDGQYAQGYRALISDGGSPEAFERRIGPIERVQEEWYGYLRDKQAEAAAPAQDEAWFVPARG